MVAGRLTNLTEGAANNKADYVAMIINQFLLSIVNPDNRTATRSIIKRNQINLYSTNIIIAIHDLLVIVA